jgi:hypothetical protein
VSDTPPTDCPDCDGDGSEPVEASWEPGTMTAVPCSTCEGSGQVVRAWTVTSQPEPFTPYAFAAGTPSGMVETPDGWRTAVEEAPGD